MGDRDRVAHEDRLDIPKNSNCNKALEDNNKTTHRPKSHFLRVGFWIYLQIVTIKCGENI